MQIDGVRVVLIQDGKQAPPVEFKDKDVVGYNVEDGALQIMVKILLPNGQYTGVPSRTYAAGTWHHVEPINLRADSPIMVPQMVPPTKLH